MTTLTERMAQLPPARRKKVDERAEALIAEEMSLRDLRRARKQTQVRVAEKLGINSVWWVAVLQPGSGVRYDAESNSG